MITGIISITLLVSLTVMLHYEILRLLSALIPKMKFANRLRVVVGVFGTICAHVIEVWLFGLAFFVFIWIGGFGSLEGNFDGSLIDCVYFSFTNYTTVGYGDIEPFGNLRFLAGMESLTGLSLITWSATFMYMEMAKFWKDE